MTQGDTGGASRSTVADTSSARRIRAFGIGYLRRYALAGFVSGTTIGVAIGSAVASLPGALLGGAVGATCGTLTGVSLNAQRPSDKQGGGEDFHVNGDATDPNTTDEEGLTELMRAVLAADFERVKRLLKNGFVDLTTANAKDNMTPFLYACSGGHESIARLLYEAKRPNKTDMFRALMSAVEKRHAHIVSWLITSCGVDLSESDASGKTALMLASAEGCCEIIRLLIDEGAAIGTARMQPEDRRNRMTAFAYACANGHTDAAQLLHAKSSARKGCALEERKEERAHLLAVANNHPETVRWLSEVYLAGTRRKGKLLPAMLATAIRYERTDILKILLSSAQDPDLAISCTDTNGSTLFTRAASLGYTEAIRLFLRINPTLGGPHTKSGLGWSPLMLASREGYTDTAELLSDFGASVHVTDHQGRTALDIAVEKGHIEIVRLFLHRGANVNRTLSPSRNTPVIVAAGKGYTEIVRLLHYHGADLKRDGYGGRTALHCAEANGHVRTVQLIEELLAKDPVDRKGAEELREAGRCGNVEAIEKGLANKDIDVNAADPKTRQTTLMLAAENGHTEVVRRLLGAPGIDVARADQSGNTALMSAAKGGREEVVKLLVLIDSGASLLRRNNRQWTALMYAISVGHETIVELLLSEIRNMRDVSCGSSDAGILGITPLVMEIGSMEIGSMEIGSKVGMGLDDMDEMLTRAIAEKCGDSVRLLVVLFGKAFNQERRKRVASFALQYNIPGKNMSMVGI